jgi:plasmid stabilization system protein ParE
MVRVVWTRRAAREFRAIRDYVGRFAPLAADRLGDRLIAAGESLADQPDRGRPLSRTRRELTIVWPYLLRYRVKNGVVEIISIKHGARRPTGR